MTPAEADKTWDVIVIGAGLGGGVAARALAEAGLEVLILEKGQAGLRGEQNAITDTPLPEARLTRGLWPIPLHANIDGLETAFFAPLGCGVGGSSVFYAATLERPERHDLETSPDRPHPTGGWPVDFDTMRPWYDRAAKMFLVHGTPDPRSSEPPLPLRSPPPLSTTERSLFTSLREAGLSPYHAHTALVPLADCDKCLGHKCPRPCKMDGRSAGIEPALETGRAKLLTRADVRRLACSGGRITGVEFEQAGHLSTTQARHVILAAGALHSPRLLLASAYEGAPEGLANGSGQVGRNLMFHLNEMFALWPRRGTPDEGATKAISFRDLYHLDQQRFGTVQAMGVRASYGEILHYLQTTLARSRMRHIPGLRDLARIPAALAQKVFGHAQIFVGLLEDLPYPHNRVLFDTAQPEKLAVEYTISPELRARRRSFRRAIRRALRGHRRMFVGSAPEINFGHACGTLRMGTDPATSVVGSEGRSHEIANLWVADASFMPTSMGVNPSLTIAAHALRVADAIAKEDCS